MKLKSTVVAVSFAFLTTSIVGCYQPTQFIPPKEDVLVASASKVSDFCGTSNVKIAFSKKSDGVRNLYYIDYNDDNPSVVKLKKPEGKEAINSDSPIISPDGKWVTYFLIQGETLKGAYIQKLGENSEPILIEENATEPHWWKDPSDGTVYVIYSDLQSVGKNKLKDLKDKNKTYRVKVTFSGSDVTIGSAEVIAPYPMNGGLSVDGRYLATGYSDAAIYDIQEGKLSILDEGMQVCNPSITADPDKTDKMLFLNFQGVQNLEGDFVNDENFPKKDESGLIDQHNVVFIVDSKNTVVDFVPLMDPYIQMQDPEWSNKPGFISLLGKIDDKTADLLLLKLSDKSTVSITPFSYKMNITSTPYLWIGS